MTGLFTPPFTLSGTVFQLAKVGRYEISYQTSFPSNGAIVLYQGQTIATLSPVTYTQTGKATDGNLSNTVIIETFTANSFLSLNAAPGNTIGIVVPALSSTNNTTSTTISIHYLAPIP